MAIVRLAGVPLAFVFPAAAALAATPVDTVDGFHAALGRGDTAAVAALLAPDALIFEAGHVERSAAEYSAGHLAGDAAHAAKTATRYVNRRCMLGTDTAVIATETVSTPTGGGDARIGTETMVLRQGADGWRIAHIHWSSRKPTAAHTPAASQASPLPCAPQP